VVGSLTRYWLDSLLFAGLLINRDKVPKFVGWIQTTSFFHAAFEALLVNEVRYLNLVDHKVGFVFLIGYVACRIDLTRCVAVRRRH
jgi:hypothetical protein